MTDLLLFEETKIALGFDPDAEVDIPLPLNVMVAKLTGATPTNFTAEHSAKVRELLDSDGAALDWVRFRALLYGTGQLPALEPGPAAGKAVNEAGYDEHGTDDFTVEEYLTEPETLVHDAPVINEEPL